LCEKIAAITDKFSFAYMQEAFVAALLAIAVRGGKDVVARGGGDDVEKLELWVEIQKQVKILKDEMEEKAKAEQTIHTSAAVQPLPFRPRDGQNLSRYRDELDVLLHGRHEGAIMDARHESANMDGRHDFDNFLASWRVSDAGRF
jgi:transitional endoplasmic reticulum ATPase